jgi:hypothetical protein
MTTSNTIQPDQLPATIRTCGVVDLRYRFVMDGDAIAELVIAP